MNFKARDALRFVRPFIGQYGAIYSFGSDNFLYLLNTCIDMVYGENGYLWSWEHTKESFPNLTPDADGVITLVTKYPIVAVDKFFTGNMLPMNGVASACDCPDPDPNPCLPYVPDGACCSSYCVCTCGEEHEYTKVLPQNKLCAGEYQVSGGDNPGMGGLNGRVIRVKPLGPVTGFWVTYYRGPNFITNFDEIVPLPKDWVSTVLPFLLASMINVDRSAFFSALYTKKITDLKNQDNIFPKKMVFDPNYPFFGNSNPNLIPQ